MECDWYKDAVVYQIYPKSFCDSNGDGIGDINGIISKLDYIKDLGINTVWISPCYKSPNADFGYDISDYRDIAPEYGTLDDFKRMLDEMHKRGIRLLMDLVVNHTSDEHEWFIESKKGRDNPYRDYYIWKDPVKGAYPNSWSSGFNESAWEWDESSGQYYLHLFTKKQPDLNWENPNVRQEIEDMVNYWLDMGVDGFRCDVINLISKDFSAKIPDNGPHLHDYLHSLYLNCFEPHNAMTVGEVWGLTPDESLELTSPLAGELSLAFQFEHLSVGRQDGKRFFPCEFDPVKFTDILAKWQYGLNGRGWNALCMENHDQPRCVNRFGSPEKYRRESATMLATLLYGMQGTVFLYEGQECGFINPVFNSYDECLDVETTDAYPYMMKTFGEKEMLRRYSFDSRDCGRIPMSWNGTENAGFTEGKSWIKLNDFRKEVNVETEINADNSVYRYYRNLIKLKKENNILKFGEFCLLNNDGRFVLYERTFEGKKLLVILRFSDTPIEIKKPFEFGKILLSNYSDAEIEKETLRLRPYEAMIIEI